jgi:hypothetical protein
LGGVHGEMESEVSLDDIAGQLGVKVGDYRRFRYVLYGNAIPLAQI